MTLKNINFNDDNIPMTNHYNAVKSLEKQNFSHGNAVLIIFYYRRAYRSSTFILKKVYHGLGHVYCMATFRESKVHYI